MLRMRSSQDAQNVWGDPSSPETTPSPTEKKSASPDGTGKTIWQSSKNRPAISCSSFEDTQILQTPPHRVIRKASSTDLSEVKQQLPSVLKRPQTVDALTTSCRKGKAKEMQKDLAKDLEEQKQKQAAEEQEEADPKNDEDAGVADEAKPTNNKKDGNPKPKQKAKASPKAKVKAKAKSSPKGKAKAAPKAKGKAKAKVEAEEGSDPGKDHDTAQSSKDKAKMSRTKNVEKAKSEAPRGNPNPDHETKKDKEKDKENENEENEKETLKQKKVIAHRLYMRFWRNVHHSPSPSSTKPLNFEPCHQNPSLSSTK